jgi:hypothetical protein
MKIKDIFDELTDAAKKNGVLIRKESGAFKSGFCTVEDKKIIVLNKMASVDYMSKIMALGVSYFELDRQLFKPAIREYIDNEVAKTDQNIFKIEAPSLQASFPDKKELK